MILVLTSCVTTKPIYQSNRYKVHILETNCWVYVAIFKLKAWESEGDYKLAGIAGHRTDCDSYFDLEEQDLINEWKKQLLDHYGLNDETDQENQNEH